MKTEIIQCLQLRFPEISPYRLVNPDPGDECIAYRLLNHFGQYCSENFMEKKTAEILLVVNTLYQSENLFIQNAIENEFLAVLAKNLDSSDLLMHLNKIPFDFQLPYIKVLLETLRSTKDESHE